MGLCSWAPGEPWRWRHQAKEAARRRAKARGGIVWARAATPAGVRQEVTGSDWGRMVGVGLGLGSSQGERKAGNLFCWKWIQSGIVCGLSKSPGLKHILCSHDPDPSRSPSWTAFKAPITGTSSVSWPLPAAGPMAPHAPFVPLLSSHSSLRIKCHLFLEASPKHAGALGDPE